MLYGLSYSTKECTVVFQNTVPQEGEYWVTIRNEPTVIGDTGPEVRMINPDAPTGIMGSRLGLFGYAVFSVNLTMEGDILEYCLCCGIVTLNRFRADIRLPSRLSSETLC